MFQAKATQAGHRSGDDSVFQSGAGESSALISTTDGPPLAARAGQLNGSPRAGTLAQRRAALNASVVAQRRKGHSKPRRTPASVLPQDEGDEDSEYVIAREGEADLSPYEEEYETPRLFWRGDNRPPSQVMETGFTTTNEREGRVNEGENRIIWRNGGGLDDILPASAICLAKDIRGSAFFPLTGATSFYLYAVGKTRVVNTFKAQRDVEAQETGANDLKAERYAYDPAYADAGNASAVWQFQEYAAHRVEPMEILGAFKVARRTLIPPYQADGGAANVAIGGIQFRLEFLEYGPVDRHKSKTYQTMMRGLMKEARETAEKYTSFYPEEDKFLSYMGIVTPRDRYHPPETLEEAPGKVRQEQAVVME